MLNDIDKSKYIHMIGIGGVSMSGIAEILVSMGFKISGSDSTESETTKRLENTGIKIAIGQKSENITDDISMVAYTAAIKSDNPELLEAKKKNIPCIERSTLLGELTRMYKDTIAICGTHGKTTTTSMASLCFIDANLDPTVQVGADLRKLNNANYRIGASDYFIIEACEYVRSFLSFSPKSVVLLNIEEDHLDYYKDLADIKSAFSEFLSYVPSDGVIVYNNDDVNCIDVAKDKTAPKITFGIKNTSDWMAKNIRLENGFYAFDAVSGDKSVPIKLSVPGYHNIYNALATIALASHYNIKLDTIKNSLLDFTGAHRRFEFVGYLNGAKIYDDYAHHPTEIKALISAANELKTNKLWVVFQPHTYSRTYTLFDEFASCFKDADSVILTSIYAAREKDTGLVSSKLLCEAINKVKDNCVYIETFEDIEKYLKDNVKPNDIVLTVGAGSITKLGYEIKE